MILRRCPGLRDHLRPSRRPGAARTRVARPCGDVGAGRHPHERHPPLDYQRHLFRERTVCSVTSNTRRDGEEFLTLAARLGLSPATTVFPFEAADEALAHVAAGDVRGAAVLRVAR